MALELQNGVVKITFACPETNDMKKLLLFFLVLCTACASTNTVVFDSTKRQPKQNVDVLPANSTLPKYKIVAAFTMDGPLENQLKATKSFLDQTKALGADALILSDPDNGGSRGTPGFGTYQNWVFKGTAVVYEK